MTSSGRDGGPAPASCSHPGAPARAPLSGESLNPVLNLARARHNRRAPQPTAPPGAPLPPLVGRAAELAELDYALDRAGGASWFVQIAGEPGIGKSRLLAALGERAGGRGWQVLSGRAAELEQDLPFAL